MPIDPNIPLAVKSPQIDSPLKTMAQLYALKNVSEEVKGRKLDNAERDLRNQKMTRDAADDAAIRQELANARTDPSGQLDVPGAISRLHAGGHGTAGMKLTQQWQEHLTKQAQQSKSEIDRHMADLEGGARLWAGVKDDASLAVAKRASVSIMGPDSNKLLENLPDDYASAKTQIDALLEAGNKMADKLKAARDSAQERLLAIEHGVLPPDPAKGEVEPQTVREARAKADALDTSSVAKMLALTDNDQEYQRQLESFKQHGINAHILNKFDTVWSKKAVEKAKSLQLTEKEVEELRLQNRNAATAEMNARTAAAREEREKNGPKLDPWHSYDMQEYNATRAEYDKANPPNQKAVKLVEDPEKPGKMKAVPNPPRKDFQTFEEWRAKVKGRNADGSPMNGTRPPAVAVTPAVAPPMPGRGAPPAGVVTPPPPQAAPAPGQPGPTLSMSSRQMSRPIGGGPATPVGGPVPPPQSPTLGANVRPPVMPPQGVVTPPPPQAAPAGAGGTPQGGVLVKLPPDKDHPQGRVIRFKDKASADAFAKAAGFTFTK